MSSKNAKMNKKQELISLVNALYRLTVQVVVSKPNKYTKYMLRYNLMFLYN